MPLFSALRGNGFANRRTEPLILDLAHSSNAAPPRTTSSRTPPSSTTPQLSGFGASGSSADSHSTPRFNDPSCSDVRIELLDGKGENHSLLHLHSSVLREQSDYFFNTLVKRGTRDSASSASDPPPTTFTIQTSRHVPDPEIYITVFRLFYQDEDLLAEDIVCLGSVWKVLQILLVSSKLQFHSCTTVCVDYLEAVPWSDDELEDIVRLMPQLENLQDAEPVLERLPVKGWCQDSIADALRMLLIKAVAFHDALGDSSGATDYSAKPGGLSGVNSDGEFVGESGLLPEPSGNERNSDGEYLPDGKPPAGGERQMKEGKEERTASAGEERTAINRPVEVGRRRRQGGQLQGLVECREAACSILRNHHEPLLPLKTKKLLLHDAFVDLLRCVWSEQRRRTDHPRSTSQQQPICGNSSEHPLDQNSPGTFAQSDKSRSEAETDGFDYENGSKSAHHAVHVDGRGGANDGHRRTEAGASEDQQPGTSPELLESVYGRQGAFTWIIQVMLEFSMADEVFKWLASDKEFLSLVLTVYRTSSLTAISESGLTGKTPRLFVVKVAFLGLASAILGKRLVVHPQMRMEFVRTWVPVLAEICSMSSSGEALLYGLPLTEEEGSTVLHGYNELVLTLPANDQEAIFQLWYLKVSRRIPSVTLVSKSERPTVAPGAAWFSLSPAYKRWLVRLGSPCAFAAVDI